MRVLIAEHESRERDTLIDLCHSHGQLANLIVVDCGSEALKQIRSNRPDVALLASELEDMSGFDVLRALDDEDRPATIIVAPDDRYPAEALLSDATDYLTRPISAERLAQALKRATSAPRQADQHGPAKRLRAANSINRRSADFPPLGRPDRLVGERGGRIYFFSATEIDYIEAHSNYVKIHVGAQRYINRDSLTRLSVQLEDMGFIRISRAILLNLYRVSFAEREGRGVLAFVLESGNRVVSSTGFRLEAGVQLRIARSRGSRRKRRVTSTPDIDS